MTLPRWAALLCIATLSSAVGAQQYPAKSVRMNVGFPPGMQNLLEEDGNNLPRAGPTFLSWRATLVKQRGSARDGTPHAGRERWR